MNKGWIPESASTALTDPAGHASGETTATTALFQFVGRPAFLALAVLAASATPASLPPLLPSRSGRHSTLTAPPIEEASPELVSHVRNLFEKGADEFFVDGTESEFSKNLLSFVELHGQSALSAISKYVTSETADPEVIGEALRWLSDVEDPETLPQRWSLLRQTIRSNSVEARDGAILGFAALDDPRAREILEDARSREEVADLRRLLDQVLEQLTAHGSAS